MIVPQSIAANGEVLFLAQGSSTFVVASNEQTFTDVSGHWSDEHIGFVTARELFLGVSNDEFAPDREITREEMASMIVGFMQHAQITASTQNRYAAFDDEASISDWAAAAIQQLWHS